MTALDDTGDSPAARYAAARRRAAEDRTPLAGFRAGYPFDLDPFQVAACEALEAGRGVLVAAPTGAGKTVVGEFAVHLALAEGRKAFYTTPIKALSQPEVRRPGRTGTAPTTSACSPATPRSTARRPSSS